MSETVKHTPTYEVTRDGRVFSVGSNWRGYGKRELTQVLNKDGYPSVRIIIDGKRKNRTVHSLVAKHFLPQKPSIRHEVRHLDGNKLNPNADNLAWGTQKENAEDRARHGRTSRGASHSAAIRASNQANGTRAFRRAQREANHV
ncbi:HNH endonuclease [Mesorhizobium sp. CA8]|uniref:HNH endonuclease n=1 Tax=Mesorhizobium sp. CA8 TaxID=2876637 RepID=UPI001CCD2B25|nr:HNH endonuclease [Mesorhizobium sp. CA8]